MASIECKMTEALQKRIESTPGRLMKKCSTLCQPIASLDESTMTIKAVTLTMKLQEKIVTINETANNNDDSNTTRARDGNCTR
jgi:ribosome-associated translation inhibitor RaiA